MQRFQNRSALPVCSLVGAFALAACGAQETASPVLGSAAHSSHNWGCYHWARTRNPFTLKVGDNVSSGWDGHLKAASTDWSKSRVLDTTVVSGSARNKQCAGGDGRVEVCNSAYGNNGWLGVAQISVSGCHIVRGSVRVNDTYFALAKYNTSAWKQFVMCQEIGHTFGLDHQDENFDNQPLGTCMDYSDPPDKNQHPNAHDFEELASIYSHLDSTTIIGSNTPMANADLATPEQWGELVSSAGARSTYVRDFGGDYRVITFVIWAR